MKSLALSTFIAVMTLSVLPATFAAKAEMEEAAKAPYRFADIPMREHGYNQVKAMALTSADDLKAFLATAKNQSGWNRFEEFSKGLIAAKVDWENESLVLLPHWEGSGSIQVKIGTPSMKDDSLTIPLSRSQPGMGTADMAYYLVAVVVERETFNEVILAPARRDAVSVEMK